MQRPRSETVTLDDILITEELSQRSPRSPNWQAEAQAMHTLARQMVNQPEILPQSIVDIALNLCKAGTAGVSLLEVTCNGQEVFRWNVLAGTLSQYLGGSIPRNFSPCGVCLERGTPVLFSHPERYFTYFQEANTPIVEGLVLPLVADSHVFGTIWIMSHDEQRHFDAEDVRVMTGLADFTAAALLLNQRQTRELLAVNAALGAKVEEHRQAEERSHALISNLPGGAAFVVDRNLRYLLAEGEALAIAGFKPEDLIGRTIFEVLPPELAANYEPLYRRALAGEPFEHEHHAHDRTYVSRGTPLHSADGEVYAVLAVSYDITDRKRREANLALLAEISEDFSRLASEEAIMQSISERLAKHLQLDGFNFADVDEAGGTTTVKYNWNAADVPNHKGTYRIADYMTGDFARTMRAGEIWVVRDAQTDERCDAEATAAIGIGSYIVVPYHRHGEWKGCLTVTCCEAREWTADEIALIREVSNRTFPPLERAHAEAALRESEAKYRSLFTSIDEGYALCEVMYDESEKPVDVRYLEVNPAFGQLSGLENAVGKTARQLNPKVESLWIETAARVAETSEAIRFENYAEGLDRWIDIYFSRVGGEGSRQIAVVFNNITDRKRAEEQLHRTAELDAFRVTLLDALRSLTDSVEIQAEACRFMGEHLGVDRAYYVEVNEAERYARVNQDYLRGDSPSLVGVFRLADYGWTVPLLQRGETIIIADAENSDIIPEADREAMAAVRIAAHISTPLVKAGALVGALCVTESEPRQWSESEVELVRETGERIWAAIERARAEVALRESEIQRIQEQAAREEERQRAESLRELDRAKTVFFSNISHEFRTPLTLLLAPLQDALSDRTNPLVPPQRERLELAHRNSLRLLKLVNTLLDFSRIEAGRMGAVYEPTDLAMLTTELASVFRSAIERAGLQLIIDCPPLPEPVYVDRQMWEKIVLNLLSNALKFTFEGEIAVRLHPESGNRVVLQIQDTGTGIPPEELPHLFERFYQVRGAKVRTHEGSGIGLALVHELIRLHGGTVDASSTVGQGTCFTISIPFGTEHLPSDRIQATPNLASTAVGAAAPYVEEAERWLPKAENRGAQLCAPTTPSNARILLVDDNANMRDYLTRILDDRFQVEAVADGAAALAAAQERVPDLVLSDVMMPGLDGFGLLQALRANPQTREIPIILLSARAGEESVVSGLEVGADDYLIKPFSAQELVSRANAHLQMSQLRSEALRQERTASRRKDELLATVSHELNTPLVAILGWTRLLRANPSNQSMLMKSLDTIERNATLQAKLIQDLLDISRIAAGKLRLSQEPVELKSAIENAIAAVKTAAIAKDIHLQYKAGCQESGTSSDWLRHTEGERENANVYVLGDRDRLHQIVCNLLSNAIKFTPESGSVTVTLSTLASENSTYAQIRVTDTGIGIPADFLPHVFDRFRQAEGAISAKGLGLGLAIARHLVELHNGTIHAESLGVGQGATFTVQLPIIK